MRVLFIASEAVPFIKTGGLADVIGSLPKELRRRGMDVRVALPKYGEIAESARRQMVTVKEMIVPLAWRNQYCGLQKLEHEGTIFYFIDNEYYFKRLGLYGYGDEAERFAFFGRAVLEAIQHMDFAPQILHCHDWHAGLVPVFLQAFYRNRSPYEAIKTVFTIHNLKYQGIFPRAALHDIFGLGDEYFTIDGLEYYGNVNCMKGGIAYSDSITTVSETYAREIRTPFFGEGLDGLLRRRSGLLKGIVNGIDYEAYDPMNDPHVRFPFRHSLAQKRKNKTALQEQLGLPVKEHAPMIAIISRLVEQKGFDLVACVIDEMLAMDIQLVVLGTGEEKYERLFLEARHRHPEKVSAHITFDDELQRKIYAAADLFLMPSRFEPCGIGQLIAFRYHCVPIVRETGGLRDTVMPYNEFTKEGTGFSFTHYNAHDMLYTIRRAVQFYHDERHWQKLHENIGKVDFSWNTSARDYVALYERLLN